MRTATKDLESATWGVSLQNEVGQAEHTESQHPSGTSPEPSSPQATNAERTPIRRALIECENPRE